MHTRDAFWRKKPRRWGRMDARGLAGVVCLAACLLVASTSPLRSQAVAWEEGPAEIGNGLSNGVGATLARLFVRVRGLHEDFRGSIPLELRLTSSLATAEPISCDPELVEPCPAPELGVAGVTGYPCEESVSVWRLKLAGAQYLPAFVDGVALPRGLRGAALETALEGALTLPEPSEPGSPVRIRLFLGDRRKLILWGANDLFPPSAREFENNTGTALLVNDQHGHLFPGTIEGRLVQDTGNSLVIQLRSLDVAPPPDPDDPNASVASLTADTAAASAAHLPGGSFGMIEINYTGLPSNSRIFSRAASNDVELHLTAQERPIVFLRGDCNGDGFVGGSVTDAVFFLQFSFGGGPEPPCLEACDSDGDGDVTGSVTDAVYVMSYSFLGGPPPPPPFPECGPADKLLNGCEAYPSCP